MCNKWEKGSEGGGRKRDTKKGDEEGYNEKSCTSDGDRHGK